MPGSLKRDTMQEAVLAELRAHLAQLQARTPARPVRGGGDIVVRAHTLPNGTMVKAYTRRRRG